MEPKTGNNAAFPAYEYQGSFLKQCLQLHAVLRLSARRQSLYYSLCLWTPLSWCYYVCSHSHDFLTVLVPLVSVHLVAPPWRHYFVAYPLPCLVTELFLKWSELLSDVVVACAVLSVEPCRVLAAVEHTSRPRTRGSRLLAQFDSMSCTEGTGAHRWLSQRPGVITWVKVCSVTCIATSGVDDMGGI